MPWDSDLSALVEVEWSTLDEAAEAAEPFAQPTLLSLGLGQGAVLEGVLNGSGSNLSETPTLEQEGCPNSPALLYPLPPGAYLGDVDVIRLSLEEGGLLCFEARFSAELEVGEELGVDAWVAELDPCGLPSAPLGDPEAPLGVGFPGVVRWQLELPPGDVALVQAAFLPDDPDRQVAWRSQMALVAYRKGDPAYCPPPPEAL